MKVYIISDAYELTIEAICSTEKKAKAWIYRKVKSFKLKYPNGETEKGDFMIIEKEVK